MRTRRILVFFLTSTAIPSFGNHALAQVSENPPNPEKSDELGVDVTKGFANRLPGPVPSISIGDPSDPLVVSASMGYGLEVNVDFMKSSFSMSISTTGQEYANVRTFPGYGRSFSCNGNACSLSPDDGSSLIFEDSSRLKVIYTNRNGDSWFFSKDGTDTSSEKYDYFLEKYKTRDGKIYTVSVDRATTTFNDPPVYYSPNYHKKRAASILSPEGYLVKYGYNNNHLNGEWRGVNSSFSQWISPSSIKIYNLATTTCSTDLTPCNESPLGQLSISVSEPEPYRTLFSITDGVGRNWQYKTTSALASVRFPGSSTDDITYSYQDSFEENGDWSGMTTTVNYRGKIWKYYAYPYGFLKRTDPLGKNRTFQSYDGQIAYMTNEIGLTTIYEHSGALNDLTKIIYHEGNTEEFSYDSRGNLVSRVRTAKPGFSLEPLSRTWTYPGFCSNVKICNRPTSSTDERGHTTEYTYDENHGGLLTVTAPAPGLGQSRPQTRYSYGQFYAWYKDASGTLAQAPTGFYKLTGTSQCKTQANCTGTADELKTAVFYQPGGATQPSNLLPLTTTTAAGDNSISVSTSYSYDSVGNKVAVDGPLPGNRDVVRTIYDGARRVVGVIKADPDGTGFLTNSASRIAYNGRGEIDFQEFGATNGQSDEAWNNLTVASRQMFSYDAIGRLARTVQSANGFDYSVADRLYDEKGRLLCVINRMDPASWTQSAAGCAPTQTTAQFGPDRVTKYVYDDIDRVVRVESGVGTGSLAVENMGYSANGKQTYIVDANSNRTTYEYDGHDRLVKTRFPVTAAGANSSSDVDYEALFYEDNVNVTAMRLRDGSTTGLTYDKLNRLTSVTPQGEATVTSNYNLLGLQTSTQRPADGGSVTFSYDALGRLTSEAQPYGSVGYQHDAAGNVIKLTWPDGFYVAYDRDTLGRVTAIRENGATSGAGLLATYAYDNLGRRTAVTYGNGTFRSYAWDGLSRLTGLKIDLGGTTNDITIGSVGGVGTPVNYSPALEVRSINRSNNAYVYTGRYSVNRGYGTNGLNQYTSAGVANFDYDSRGNLTSSGSTTYSYNRQNQMTGMSGGIGLRYDALGRLIEYHTGTATRMYYGGADLLAETDASASTILRRYVPGPSTDEPVVWYEGNGTNDRRFLQADERGSIVAISDASGNAIALNRYDEYGIPQSGNVGRFQYTGQAWYPELGMYYYKARIYSPSLGRFMQTDPIGYGDGANLYSYAGNNPITGIDSTGLSVGCSMSLTCQTYVVNGGSFNSASYGGEDADRRPGDIIVTAPRMSFAILSDFRLSSVDRSAQLFAPAISAVLDRFVQFSNKTGQCLADELGLEGAAGAGMTAAGQPIAGTKRFVTPGSSLGTSRAGQAADAIFGKARLPVRLPTIVGGPGTGRALAVAGTKSVARFAGRAVPIVGEGLIAYDAVSVGTCMGK